VSGQMTGRMVRNLGEFVAELERLHREYQVDVCAYGGIDLRVEDYDGREAYVRLTKDGAGTYVIEDQP
jgi:hypothetical protein